MEKRGSLVFIRMTKLHFLVAAAFVIAFAGACKRTSREYADVPNPGAAQPAYDTRAQLATVPALSVIREVLPVEEKLDGAALYVKNCAACHQISGMGIPAVFPPLGESKYVTSDNVDRLASIMIYGLIGPIKVNGVQYTSAMAPLGATLKDEELAAIATYIRSSFGNKASPVQADVFKRVREKWAARGPFQISELGAEE